MKIYILGFVLFLFSTIYSFCWIDKNLLRISDTSFMFAKIAFIVSAGTMHSLRSEGDLYVGSFLVPVVDDRLK